MVMVGVEKAVVEVRCGWRRRWCSWRGWAAAAEGARSRLLAELGHPLVHLLGRTARRQAEELLSQPHELAELRLGALLRLPLRLVVRAQLARQRLHGGRAERDVVEDVLAREPPLLLLG